MTTAQRVMLFRLFSELMQRRCIGSAQREIERENLTVEWFGFTRSWSTFGNAEVDRVKSELLALLNPDDLQAQMDQVGSAEIGERKRVIWKLKKLMVEHDFSDAYFISLARDLYDARSWADLTLDQLKNLRNTIANRGKRRAGDCLF